MLAARECTESWRQTKPASVWFLARSISSSGTGSFFTRSISAMMACSRVSGVCPGSGVPENQKRLGSCERYSYSPPMESASRCSYTSLRYSREARPSCRMVESSSRAGASFDR